MSVLEELNELLAILDGKSDELVVEDLSQKIWDRIDKIDCNSDPFLVDVLVRAKDSKISSCIINSVVLALGEIANNEAVLVLESIIEEYASIDFGVSEMSKQMLAEINPVQYINQVSQDQKYHVIRGISKNKFDVKVFQGIEALHEGVSLVNDLGMSLMWVALDNDNVEMFEYLIDRKIDLGIKNVFGETAVDYAAKINNSVSAMMN